MVQAFLHAPPLRDFFLGGGHGPATCPATRECGRGACLPCELATVFYGAYSGDRAPLAPAPLLAAWWAAAGGGGDGAALVGAGQHDAHEFFLGALCALAGCRLPARAGGEGSGVVAVGGAPTAPPPPPAPSSLASLEPLAIDLVRGAGWDGAPAPPAAPARPATPRGAGVAASAFGGVLRSDVTCTRCGFTSTAYDPFLDVSLDIASVAPPRPPRAPAGGGGGGVAVAPAAAPAPPPLADATAAVSDESPGGSGGGVSAGSGVGDASAAAPARASPSPPPARGPSPAPTPSAAGRRVARSRTPRRRCGECAPCQRPGSKKACLRPVPADPRPPRPPGGGGNGASALPGDGRGAGAATLLGCLRRFVAPEPLGAAGWHCDGCGAPSSAVKQMSVRRAPPVLCLHVKRFESGGGARGGRKLDTPLSFPATLDMTPFMSAAVLADRMARPPGGGGRGGRCGAAAGGAAAAAAAAAAASAAPAPPPHQLYAVVSHSGSLAGGHYVAHVRAAGGWFLVDDGAVLPSDEAAAMAAQPYLLFYRRAGADDDVFGVEAE